MIPKIVWQTWKSHNLPSKPAWCRQTWIDRNPDYRVVLMDDDECRETVKSFGDFDLLTGYDKLPLPVMKADVWRYAIVYLQGGFYTDIDTSCNAPIASWLSPEASFVVANEVANNLCQWTFAAEARHPALERVLRLFAERASGILRMNSGAVHHYTGPSLWTDALTSYFSETLRESDVRYTRDAGRLREHGVHVYGPQHFRTGVSHHHHGGDSWGDVPGYVGWKPQLRSYLQKVGDMEKVYSDIYARDRWGGGSGPGSAPLYCAPLADFLSEWLNLEGARSLCDLGCGDLQWMPSVVERTGVRYVGVDCVPDLIERHTRERAGDERYEFRYADVSQMTSYPDADVYFIKDVLQHWPTATVADWLQRFFAACPDARLLVVNCTGQPAHRSLQNGGFSPLDGDKPPFADYEGKPLFAWATKRMYELRRSTVLAALETVQPHEGSFRRVGSAHDGGYIVVDGIGDYDLLLSGGVERDISFEQQLLDLHPQLRGIAFDGSVPGLPNGGHARLEFRKQYIGPNGADLRDALGAATDAFLKIDIEGGEVWQFEVMDETHLSRFKQIVVEFHDPYDASGHLLVKLRKTHDLVHVHGNNHAPTRPFKGATVPRVFEATYVRKHSSRTPLKSTRTLPTDLDRPNNPHARDILLRGYPWP